MVWVDVDHAIGNDSINDRLDWIVLCWKSFHSCVFIDVNSISVSRRCQTE
jgi:hypothetical protein